MTTNNHNNPILCDIYYKIRISQREASPRRWLARAIATRQDSEEDSCAILKSGHTKAEALMKIELEVEDFFKNLDRPPVEWMRTELRSLIKTYKHYNEKITSAIFHFEDERASEMVDEATITKRCREISDLSVEMSITIISLFENLEEQDKIDLLTSADNVYLNASDPSNLEDLTIRHSLFKFIINPSAELTKAHERHLERIKY